MEYRALNVIIEYSNNHNAMIEHIISVSEKFGGMLTRCLIYAELSGDFPLGDSRQPTYKSLRPFDLVS